MLHERPDRKGKKEFYPDFDWRISLPGRRNLNLSNLHLDQNRIRTRKCFSGLHLPSNTSQHYEPYDIMTA